MPRARDPVTLMPLDAIEAEVLPRDRTGLSRRRHRRRRVEELGEGRNPLYTDLYT